MTGKQKEQVLGFHILIKHKRDGNIKAHGKEQQDHVTKGDLSSPMVLEEVGMHTCVTNAQACRDVAVASIPNTCVQTVTSNDSKAYLSSETMRCNNYGMQ